MSAYPCSSRTLLALAVQGLEHCALDIPYELRCLLDSYGYQRVPRGYITRVLAIRTLPMRQPVEIRA